MNGRWHKVVGIDLGTTYSAVAVYDRDNESTMVVGDVTDANRPTTPSVASFNPATGGVTVGSIAKRNRPGDPDNTVVEVKREMGEYFDEKRLDHFQARGLFRARDAEHGVTGDPVKIKFAGEWMLPQEISAFILMKMKGIAENMIGDEIHDAVITVPAYFHESQRAATQEAALLAGLYPRQIIAEPTAAAICYGLDHAGDAKRVYLVYDLGGGTFDVSIIAVEEVPEVIATSGDARLGGVDFDGAIADWAVEKLWAENGVDLRQDRVAREKLKQIAEAIKILLSTSGAASLPIGDVYQPGPNDPLTLELTSDVFESLISRRIDESLRRVDEALVDAAKKGIQRDQIDAVLLVGGSSKIPCVERRILEHFGRGGDFIRKDANPDEVVARGAAVLALRYAPTPGPFKIEQAIENLPAQQGADTGHLITEHTLGVATQPRAGQAFPYFSRIVPRGTNIPITKRDANYTNAVGGETDVEVRVYQGEADNCYENTQIGTIHVGPLPPQAKETHKFAVTFSLDINGVLTTTVENTSDGRTFPAQFRHATGVGRGSGLTALREKLLRLYEAEIVPLAPAVAVAGAGVAAESWDELRDATPDELKQLVRRVRKYLIDHRDTATLEAALEALRLAIVAGRLETEIVDLGDAVADAFDEARH